MGKKAEEIEREIIDTFASASSFVGYSEAHGKIIGALIVSNGAMSLEEVAKKTGYSVSTISLSIDLLEVLGIVRRVKKRGDRRLYLELDGDILEALKAAVMLKVTKASLSAYESFERYKEEIGKMHGSEKAKLLKSLGRLEKEMKRMGLYLNELSKVKMPNG